MSERAIYSSGPILAVTSRQAQDMNLFGPVYHGTGSLENYDTILREGFQYEVGEARSGFARHGFQYDVIGGSTGLVPYPVHFLGYGIYFSTSEKQAKSYGVTGGHKFYLDVPRLEVINFGSLNNIVKWWFNNGYLSAIAEVDRVAATLNMSAILAEKFDAVYFKGKGFRGRLLDGNQICVYEPKGKVYVLDDTRAQPYEPGSWVKRHSDGEIGQIIVRRRRTSDRAVLEARVLELKAEGDTKTARRIDRMLADCALSETAPDIDYLYEIKWKKGPRDYNVLWIHFEPYVGRKRRHRYSELRGI